MDISSFLLFEATGDSETGCFDPAIPVIVEGEDDDAESCSCYTATEFLPGVGELSGLEHKADVAGDDDAESCSCDTATEFLPGVGELSGLEHKASVVGDDDDDDDEGEVVELQKDDGLHKICGDEYNDYRRFNGVGKRGKKSYSVSVDSTETLKEKNSPTTILKAANLSEGVVLNDINRNPCNPNRAILKQKLSNQGNEASLEVPLLAFQLCNLAEILSMTGVQSLIVSLLEIKDWRRDSGYRGYRRERRASGGSLLEAAAPVGSWMLHWGLRNPNITGSRPLDQNRPNCY
ncbi:hypothetical protein F3Y22_tig00110548pilonHSYRG01020 [Hibiscus syriacus]|uniref:Uncharacterized protein n=1 Tax=Hibiscus syriacus TaxID=106335 RepID=A0A6A3ABZ8_HIBSY|nr:hypothetical protein F3Y22_tig00110548pilonHSYRG01020 [Hibiscus syriacus]